jgi:hypothetical protein
VIGRDRTIWVRVANGVEIVDGRGPGVWLEPSAVCRALGDLLGIFPATHVQIDLEALLRAGGSRNELLDRTGPWGSRLDEILLAVAEASGSARTIGLGLPDPAAIAPDLGDGTERGQLKAGMRLAAFLRSVRDSRIGFVCLDATVSDALRPAAPVLRNAGLYGLRRALRTDRIAGVGAAAEADAWLVEEAELGELVRLWEAGQAVGGGLGSGFWRGADLPRLPGRCLLYGSIPEGCTPRDLVTAGRRLASGLV